MFEFLKKSTTGGNGLRKPWIILLGAVMGVLLLLLGGKSNPQKNEAAITPKTQQNEIVEYQEYLENRVVSICESVAGVGRVHAVVTLSGGFEAVYATEPQGENESYVILGSGSAASGLLLVQKAPQVVGIGIVCSGAESSSVRGELISLVSASFHVPTNRIYVTQAKK